ncbi:hypothetical protein M758_3G173000 [Ceratodon purpureus]|uniref:Uncharacterized protein n=1 Tax=Ceratodon purpureus TaxID=3225 RepID=A0A8T0IJL6_CERPU|nr:hypothetical protein KC19_3G175200 [Ceratodon purpureus]KAG0623409.1 hypothetical protein M758_3G173000 [Ceratodon purpureus]
MKACPPMLWSDLFLHLIVCKAGLTHCSKERNRYPQTELIITCNSGRILL